MANRWESFIAWEQSTRDTIDVKKIYIDLAGDLITGILLSQVIYWHLLDKFGNSKLKIYKDNRYWLAKTRESWWDECRITPKQFDRAVSILEKKRIIITHVFQYDGKTVKHISINQEHFLSQLNNLMSYMPNTGKIGNSPFGNSRFTERVIPDLPKGEFPFSTETTREITYKDIRKESNPEIRHSFSNRGENPNFSEDFNNKEKLTKQDNVSKKIPVEKDKDQNKKTDIPNQHPEISVSERDIKEQEKPVPYKKNIAKFTSPRLRPAPQRFPDDSDEIRLSKLLYDLIKEKDPKTKQPDWQTWAISINRLINLDSRTPDEIEKVIRWCQASNFWYANILSTEKLREKFQQLFLLTQWKKDRRQNGTDSRYHENNPKKYDGIVTVVNNDDENDPGSGYDILNDL